MENPTGPNIAQSATKQLVPKFPFEDRIPKRPLRPVGYLLLFLLIGLLSFRLGGLTKDVIFSPPQKAFTDLEVDPDDLNFGEVWEEENFQWSVRVKNTSTEGIEVLSIATSCTCLSVEPSYFKLLPMEQKTLTLHIDLMRPALQPSTSPHRQVNIELVPRIHGRPFSRHPWIVHGYVKSALALEPRQIDFDDNLIKSQPFYSRKVTITEHVPLSYLRPHLDEAVADIRMLKLKDKPGQYELEITPKASLPAGPFSFVVNLEGATKSGVIVARVPLPIRGRIKEEVEAIPSCMQLGARCCGETINETIILRSLVHKSFEVLQVNTSTKDIQLKALANTHPDESRYALSWSLSKSGDQVERIDFILRYESGRTVSVSVAASAHGTVRSISSPTN